ncbi:MAG: preprotein translocase subunit SecA [Anaerolineae bacterium]|nr:preprotein translocase subunit SecA [Anaerolineae bacterium]MDW8172886.1 preprotein translocase subunit SecA [Anaerolineae bacterium]
MFKKIMRAVFGDPMQKAISKYRLIVDKINAHEEAMKARSDAELRAMTDSFKARLAQGETLDDLLPEAFALVREASQRTIGMRHYDVQMIGGIVLHEGRIAEMKTGEGKTLVATLPLYLNALTGRGVHLVTPNDYLSKYGLQMMGPIYHFLGLSASVIQNTGGNPDDGSFVYDPNTPSNDARYQNLRPVTRREAYQADITYGTNNEFGFDYLRDNMVWDKERITQRPLYFAIVDEVDNILIDEARTPLIISGQADEPSNLYSVFTQIVKTLRESSPDSVDAKEPDGDYVVDIKDRIAYLTEKGVEQVERLLRANNLLKADQLYHPDNAEMIPYLDNCLRAKALYHNDKEYVIQNGEIVIVDEFTGRLMVGRRFSEGLHQAIEAKEGVQIRRENITMATITFQNFFRMYDKLAGMTGTALTEQEEFEKIYELDVVVIPTHRPVIRKDHQDLIYMTQRAKWEAVVAEIKARHEKGQPVLVGTVAIETSEHLSKLLKKERIDHEVLNAKQHEREAGIIAQAGRPGAVTIATNMAGRGVDILLGGNPEGLARENLRRAGIEITQATPEQWQEALNVARAQCEKDRLKVLETGGLFVLGTERHEARRIDNQLRGRAGRQGDPGESRFYLSLEDDLMRRFNGEQVKKFMQWTNLPEDEPLEHKMITRSIEQAQIRVEGHNFDIRKRVLEYDDVVNVQRDYIYKVRRDWLNKDESDLMEAYLELIQKRLDALLEEYAELPEDLGDWDDEEREALYKELLLVYPVPQEVNHKSMAEMDIEALREALHQGAERALDAKRLELETAQPGLMAYAQRLTMLRVIDIHWQRHLTALDMLREGIGLMSIAQRDPLVEYKREAFAMFNEMRTQIDAQAGRDIFFVRPASATPQRRTPMPTQQSRRLPSAVAAALPRAPQPTTASAGGSAPTIPQPVRKTQKLGRNDKCWCGSGKKYKDCHMREDERANRLQSQP